MLKHILESAAFAAKNAASYTKVENKRLKRLASLFIRTQLLGTILSPRIDRAANKIHRLGFGIVVNDIPKIPFEE